MAEDCTVIKSMGICQLCKHNIYEDKTYPTWMACYCEKPTIKVVVPPPPIYYDDYE